MDDWLSTTEAARRLGIDRAGVCRLIESGELPACRLGRVYFLMSGDVQAYRSARSGPPTLQDSVPA